MSEKSGRGGQEQARDQNKAERRAAEAGEESAEQAAAALREGRAPGVYGEACPRHQDPRPLVVTGALRRILFPWQRPQPQSGRGPKKTERVGWMVEKDGHWEAELRCACGALLWCLGDLARADACRKLREAGEAPPPGADPQEEAEERGRARAELRGAAGRGGAR